MTLMTRIVEWEEAWAEYVAALENYESDWSGEDFVIDIGRAARRLEDARQHLRCLDRDFCTRLGI